MKKIHQILSDMIAIDSSNPEYSDNVRGEKQLGDYICEYFIDSGIDCQKQVVTGERANIIANVPGNPGDKNRKSILLCSHMDTVYIEGMKFKPFTRAGRIYGPGACDAKGSLASMMNAVREISRTNKRKHDIWFAAVVSEEIYQLGIKRFLEDFRSFDAAVIGEPTSLNIGTAHKGFIRLKIRTYGKSAHAATPDLGINAIYIMNEIISEIRDTLIPSLDNISHEMLGSPTINPGKIQGGISFNLVPDSCTLLVDRRTIPGEEHDAVVEGFSRAIKKVTGGRPGIRAEILDDIQDSPSLETPVSERIVQAALNSSGHRDSRTGCFGFPYVTDGGLVAREDIPVIILGPGDTSNCHVLDEYIMLDELQQASDMYKKIYMAY